MSSFRVKWRVFWAGREGQSRVGLAATFINGSRPLSKAIGYMWPYLETLASVPAKQLVQKEVNPSSALHMGKGDK